MPMALPASGWQAATTVISPRLARWKSSATLAAHQLQRQQRPLQQQQHLLRRQLRRLLQLPQQHRRRLRQFRLRRPLHQPVLQALHPGLLQRRGLDQRRRLARRPWIRSDRCFAKAVAGIVDAGYRNRVHCSAAIVDPGCGLALPKGGSASPSARRSLGEGGEDDANRPKAQGVPSQLRGSDLWRKPDMLCQRVEPPSSCKRRTTACRGTTRSTFGRLL
jgi:hypothetical protein